MKAEGTVRRRDDGRYELTPKANAELEVSFGTFSRTPRTGSDAVEEIQSLVSFVEDLAKTKPSELHAQKEQLLDLARRLEKLAS
jgi:DNA-binding PadR family transcriptional regulator